MYLRVIAYRLVLFALGIGLITEAIATFGQGTAEGASSRSSISGSQPSQAAFDVAIEQFLDDQGRISPDAYGAAGVAAARSPLAAEPFFIFGVRALVQGDARRGEQLLMEARRRAPRNRLARLLLTDILLRSNRPGQGAREIATLSRLMPEVDDLLVPELTRLALDPDTAAATRTALASSPLFDNVLEYLARGSTPADVTLELAQYRKGPPSAGTKRWQYLILAKLVAKDEVAQARSAWERFSGVHGATDALYDPGFKGAPGTAPFNWTLAASDVGTAEAGDGGLSVEYYGRQSAPLATQLMTLPEGPYTLVFQASGDVDPESGGLAWRIACNGSDKPILDLPLNGVTRATARFSRSFVVPSDCAGQWIGLFGTSSEFPTDSSVRISDLTLARGTSTK